MPKVNVYVPDELLAKVRGAEIAVSPICQQALAAELRRLAAVDAARSDLQAVARRLASTRAQAQRRAYAEGMAIGVRWAREKADLDDLEVIERAVGRGWQLPYRSVPSLVGALLAADPDLDVDPDDWINGETSSFDRGVLDGAAEVYRAVLPLLEHPERDSAPPGSTRRRPSRARARQSTIRGKERSG